MNDNLTAWLNKSKTKCMILDDKRMFVGNINKDQLKAIIDTIPEGNIINPNTPDYYFTDYFEKFDIPKVELNTILFNQKGG